MCCWNYPVPNQLSTVYFGEINSRRVPTFDLGLADLKWILYCTRVAAGWSLPNKLYLNDYLVFFMLCVENIDLILYYYLLFINIIIKSMIENAHLCYQGSLEHKIFCTQSQYWSCDWSEAIGLSFFVNIETINSLSFTLWEVELEISCLLEHNISYFRYLLLLTWAHHPAHPHFC